MRVAESESVTRICIVGLGAECNLSFRPGLHSGFGRVEPTHQSVKLRGEIRPPASRLESKIDATTMGCIMQAGAASIA